MHSGTTMARARPAITTLRTFRTGRSRITSSAGSDETDAYLKQLFDLGQGLLVRNEDDDMVFGLNDRVMVCHDYFITAYDRRDRRALRKIYFVYPASDAAARV